MLSNEENVVILSRQIRALLELCQNASLLNMLQWIVGHPLLRPLQLSLSFFELTPEMNWRFVQGAGSVSFAGLAEFEDAHILEFCQADQTLPWGFFEVGKNSSEFMPQVQGLEVVGLCLGSDDISDGMLICCSKSSFDFKAFSPVYSFILVASEFIYRHHYLHSSAQMRANSKDEIAVAEPPNLLERDSSLDGVVLTDRQSKILELISAGLTNEEISTQMHLSLGTIRVETSRLYDRLGARNRQQAASLAHLVLESDHSYNSIKL